MKLLTFAGQFVVLCVACKMTSSVFHPLLACVVVVLGIAVITKYWEAKNEG